MMESSILEWKIEKGAVLARKRSQICCQLQQWYPRVLCYQQNPLWLVVAQPWLQDYFQEPAAPYD